MASYSITVYGPKSSFVTTLPPVSTKSEAIRLMLKRAGLSRLPDGEPATRSEDLEIWVINGRQYRIRTHPDVLVSSVQAVAALG